MRNWHNKYSAKKTYSELCGRMFDSKAEARRGEELAAGRKQDRAGKSASPQG